MKITNFRAENVHGYLPIDIDFFPDLTFLTGLNGSGKTSAIRLIMALLVPDIEEFASIEFEKASVTVVNDTDEIIVTAIRTPDGLTLTTSAFSEPLSLTSADLQLIIDAARRDESRLPVVEKITAHPVYKAIASMSTPMFLGLDRRLVTPALRRHQEDVDEARRREFYMRRYLSDFSFRGGSAGVLADVNYLLVSKTQEIRAEQEQLDENIRNRFFTRAFQYKPIDLSTGSQIPSRAEIDRYRAMQTAIERAAVNLRLPVPELKAALTQFFESMTRITAALEQASAIQRSRPKKGKSEKTTNKREATENAGDEPIIEWFFNKQQADRVIENVELFEEYSRLREELHEPINRFLSLLNKSFLLQTNKTVTASGRSGELLVSRGAGGEAAAEAPITALSSGERQILVMLAHLSFNPNLAGSGVFIVDEPELSLHIDWQERFVDAVIKANPNVQLIFATHSPAIIVDRYDACRSLS